MSLETPERDERTADAATPEPDEQGRPAHVATWPVGLGIVATIAGGDRLRRVASSSARATRGSAARSRSRCSASAWRSRSGAATSPATRWRPAATRCRRTTSRARPSSRRELDEHASVITRRTFLSKALVFGIAVFALSQVVLLGALGPWPGDTLTTTGWRKGRRLVTDDGEPLKASEVLATGGMIVAFPEGGEDKANSQVVLLHFVNGDFVPQPGRESWSPDAFVAYSRVCTHAGCPVAEYLDVAQKLVCPCHQSEFDLLHGAQAEGGPASRPLPQLPLAIDADGFLVAQSDFLEDVGPGFWNAT